MNDELQITKPQISSTLSYWLVLFINMKLALGCTECGNINDSLDHSTIGYLILT